ncbi:hypothetical protein BDBG_08602 [Blastomyces gilchristii SLH14081]|uniref:Uncharacterized protein n=1 Tax=Blastomyces gilchristii (strain SLH14081) TaxID=559298 RepID=A0A179UZ76_BLAGS|nr:uncharacterized protein BDBG_08602 [Blastomyces gilchristii SLH14081]OAT13394.1 hypothetical protein BDBG_08602 [Blastomyces gilchristii SLH14081]
MWRLETGVLRISFAWSIPGCRYELAKANPQVQGWRGEFISVEKLLLPSTSIKESFWPMWLLTARHMCGENCGLGLSISVPHWLARTWRAKEIPDQFPGSENLRENTRKYLRLPISPHLRGSLLAPEVDNFHSSQPYSALADWVKGKLKDSCPRFDSIFRLRERWWANQRKCEE